MKLNSIFNIGPIPLALVAAAAVGSAGCRARATAAVPDAADGGDAQRVVALLDYVAGDYGRAVQGGRIVSEPEYDEQVRFAADARAMAARLVGPQAGDDDLLLGQLAEVEARVQARADAGAVAQACRAARDEAVGRFDLRTAPVERPSLEQAEKVYATACASCHGAGGGADTERARSLDPQPASFRDPGRLETLSPYRVYNALTFGVPGTAMASFAEALSPAQRWSLAFYVFRLGHAGQTARGPVAMTLADLAVRSDGEVLAQLRDAAHPHPDQALAFARRDTAFSEPPAGVGLDRTRQKLRQAAGAYAAGRQLDADRAVLDAYLQGFEPLEPRLRARDPEGTLAVEAAFRDLRAAMIAGDGDGVRARAAALDRRLERFASTGPARVVPFGAAFLIYLREGLEAALLVGALLAGVRRLGRPDAVRYVHAGWLAAIPAGVATWWALDRLVSLGADRRELVEAAVALVAAAVLFSVSFWMVSHAQARHWMTYLRGQLEGSLGRGRLLLLLGLSFLAVYREAAETVLFTQALRLEAGARTWQVWGGALTGVVAVVAAALLLRGTVMRLPIGPFFAVSGALLCALSISFAGSGIYTLVASGYLTPRPVAVVEVPWLGVHPELSSLSVQLAILAVVAGAALVALLRRPAAGKQPAASSGPSVHSAA